MNRDVIESLLAKLISELDNDNTLGLILVGSYANGRATPYSDIDMTRFVYVPEPSPTHRLNYHEGKILSLMISPMPQNVFARPESAIWTVPMWRSAQILLDKTGQLATLQAEAQAFRWEEIQTAADRYVSFSLYRKSEDLQKLLYALESDDSYYIALASGWISQWMAQAVAIRYGTFLTSERAIFPTARSIVGESSRWSHWLDHALGITAAKHASIHARGVATLRLYCETATVMGDLIQTEHQLLIEMAITAANKFLAHLS